MATATHALCLCSHKSAEQFQIGSVTYCVEWMMNGTTSRMPHVGNQAHVVFAVVMRVESAPCMTAPPLLKHHFIVRQPPYPLLQHNLAFMMTPSHVYLSAADSSQSRASRDLSVRTLLAIAAEYICLAHALQPSKDIYKKSLSVVRQMLPLPFLRAGYFTAPRAKSIGSVTETYRRDWFVLDHKSLRQASSMETSLSTAGAGTPEFGVL